METNNDQVMNLLQKLYERGEENHSEIKRELANAKSDREIIYRKVTGIENRMDDFSQNFVRQKDHLILKQAIEKIASHLGISLDLKQAQTEA